MNTANLQMEGTLLALAALCDALKRKGILSAEEIDEALGCAERGVSKRNAGGMSDANLEAIRFPIRFLQLASRRDCEELDYAAVAASVGRRPHSPRG